MAAPQNRDEELTGGEVRREWTTPSMKRMWAGSAENGFPGESDGAFTES